MKLKDIPGLVESMTKNGHFSEITLNREKLAKIMEGYLIQLNPMIEIDIIQAKELSDSIISSLPSIVEGERMTYKYEIYCLNCGVSTLGEKPRGQERPGKELCSNCGCFADTRVCNFNQNIKFFPKFPKQDDLDNIKFC